MPWLDAVGSVLQVWYPGQEAGNATADILLGKLTPGGRLPQTFPLRLSDMPMMNDDASSYPGGNGHVRYKEGLFFGYRHFDRSETRPLFPFGYSLTYARTEWTLVSPSKMVMEDMAIAIELAIAMSARSRTATSSSSMSAVRLTSAVPTSC